MKRSIPGSIDLLFLTDYGAVVTGSPPEFSDLPEEQQHNCDAMGCQQMHVLKRFASYVDERTAPLVPENLAELVTQLPLDQPARIYFDCLRTKEGLRVTDLHIARDNRP